MGQRFDDSHSASRALFARARRVMPGGTSKANVHIHPHPLCLAGGRGCRVTEVEELAMAFPRALAGFWEGAGRPGSGGCGLPS